MTLPVMALLAPNVENQPYLIELLKKDLLLWMICQE